MIIVDLLTFLPSLIALADCGSVTRAAESLSYAQPTVSMHIKELEQYYGVALFDYRKKRYTLTEEGQVLYGYATNLLHLTREASDAMSEFRTALRGNLWVGATSNIGVYVLPKVLSEYQKRFSGITVSAHIDKTPAIEAKVLGGELNVGLIEADIAESDRLVVEPWIQDRLVLIVSPGDLWAGRESVLPDELGDRMFVTGERGSGTNRVLQRAMGDDVVGQIKVALQLGSTEAVKRAVESNLGVSIVTESSVYRETALGTLRSVPIQGVDLYKTFSLIYLRNRYQTLATRNFINMLRETGKSFAEELNSQEQDRTRIKR